MSGQGYTVVCGAAATWLDETDINYVNRMLSDLCSSYTKYRDTAGDKQGGNFNGLPHRLWDMNWRFGGEGWPCWYPTVALNSPKTQGVGKRRLILQIRNNGNCGLVEAAIFSPTHYGDNKKPSTPDFVRLTGLTFNCWVGFAYKTKPPTVSLPVVQQAPAPTPAPTLVVASGFPTSPPAEDFVPDWVKQLRRDTGESFFTGTPDPFFRLQPGTNPTGS